MMACIKAKVPFVVFKHNCVKIEGVLQQFNSNIPITMKPNELERNMDWALSNEKEYNNLFDKVHGHAHWKLIDYL